MLRDCFNFFSFPINPHLYEKPCIYSQIFFTTERFAVKMAKATRWTEEKTTNKSTRRNIENRRN